MPKTSNHSKSSNDDLDEDYRKKRDRNNEAVKRSRVKNKQKVEETESRVDQLKTSIEVKENSIGNLQKELNFLKDLFTAQVQAKSDILKNIDLENILNESDDEVAT